MKKIEAEYLLLRAACLLTLACSSVEKMANTSGDKRYIELVDQINKFKKDYWNNR